MSMSLPSKSKRLSRDEIDSIESAVNDSDIRAIHPDKMEEWAEHLVEKLRSSESNRQSK